MKWTTPAFVLAPAFILAFAPAGFVAGQSSSSNSGGQVPGPIAELLPERGSDLSKLGIDVIEPPTGSSTRSFNLPSTPKVNPLPAATPPTQTQTPSASPPSVRGSLINEPVPYSQVPQIQSDMYSLDDTFTLPRTPVSTAPRTTSPTPIAAASPATESVVYQPTVAASAGQIEWNECTTCEENYVEPCDSCNECESSEITVDDCGCGECGEFEAFETVPCSDGYFETGEQGYVVKGDSSGRTVKQGVFSRHCQKHRERHQEDGCIVSDSAACGVDDGCYPIEAGAAGQGNAYQSVVAPTDPTDLRTNTLLNVSGVYFNRNTPNGFLSAERVPAGGVPTQFLTTRDPDLDSFGGFDATLTRRRATGKGIELRYLNLSPGSETATLGGSPVTLVNQFGNIGQAGGITHQNAFDLADTHELSRDFSIQNAEFNFLRMGRLASTRRGQRASTEYLIGFRYFNFEESLRYSGVGIRSNSLPGGDISRADYVSNVENDLYGAQFGGRSEIGLFNRMSVLVGLKAGIFANDFSSSQRASVRGLGGEERVATVLSGPNQGAPFAFSGEDTDYTLLAEIDLGLAYRLTSNIRVRGGYKAIFIDDIALADTQAAGDFRDIAFVSQPTANEDLVLYGGYLGLDFAF